LITASNQLTVLLAAGTLVGAAACALPEPSPQDPAGRAEAPLGGAESGHPEGRRPPPPPPCETTDDCTDECPPDARGCTCGDTPMGQRCIPTCEQDADCPSPPGHSLGCVEGLCRPEEPPPGHPPDGPPPPPCETTDDCTDECPPDARGCTCSDTPMGQRCIPTCEQDADCPSPPGHSLTCDEGICKPPPPPPR
jgi:hypothetical protein